ncbi:hypothetical protein C7H19_06565 [Aphanothece hegewaldii CCALA 016]|uniref:Uncharacterized protein n=1 Tax=Aphanothece hegewaldii CCALA 016 TaxID=2107694 RepID=A0A2T1M0D1_9CHRO|nr:hypothetical protein [Aphanothece hegewaldii]PSF38128.1 hypothetical protein C7H19_06565 [Aphanothece hegewaldii CCALA 016]
MTQLSLNSLQQAKLAEALKVALLAEEKASQMSELATEIANKYQQYLYELAQEATESSNLSED